MLRNKLYSILEIGGFSISFAICIIIGLFLYQEFNMDQCFENHEQIYCLHSKQPDCSKNIDLFKYSDKIILEQQFPEIEKICPVLYKKNMNSNFIFVKTEADHIFLPGGMIKTDPSFFDFFSIQTLKSISQKFFPYPNSIILTETGAKKIFGDKEPLGKIIHDSLIVTAVIKDFPQSSSFKEVHIVGNYEDMPLKNITSNRQPLSGNDEYAAFYIQLKKNVVPETFQEKLNQSHDLFQTEFSDISMQRIDQIYLNPEFMPQLHKSGSKKMILFYSSIGLLILILSLLNQIIFILSMQLKKIKLIGINRVTGASFWHILNFNIAETFLLFFTAFIIANLFTALFINTINSMKRHKQHQNRWLHIHRQDLILQLPLVLMKTMTLLPVALPQRRLVPVDGIY